MSKELIYDIAVIGAGSAGVAAAISLQDGTSVKDVNVEALLAQLRKQGAFVEKEIQRP